jgi:coenzyme F420-0:L-glutamate ligase / coenzyme F420-1:gamma-L-glutamate ligase
MVNIKLEVIPIHISAEIKPKDKLELIILESISQAHESLYDKDIIVIAQKIISKAEGRIVNLNLINPSDKSIEIARKHYKDARIIEMILSESKEIIREKRGIIIAETRQGFVCANAGVDQSNVKDSKNYVVLLPIDADKSARKLRHSIKERTTKKVAIVITDTFGRPFREGQTNVAIGIAGIKPIKSYVGTLDMYGRKLKVTEIAIADEIAAAAELVMGKSDRIPVAIVRGCIYDEDDKCSISPLLRKKENDLFR